MRDYVKLYSFYLEHGGYKHSKRPLMEILVDSFRKEVVLLPLFSLPIIKNVAESIKQGIATLTEISVRCFSILMASKRASVILSKTPFISNW